MWKFLIFSIFKLVTSQSTWPPGTSDPSSCICAPTGQCSFGGGGASNPSDGTGQLDARILGTGVTSGPTGTTNQLCYPVSTGINIAGSAPVSCAAGLERCCPSMGYTCGIRYPTVQNAPTPSQPGQAAYGAFPYQVVILTQYNAYIGSGVCIDQFHVLTAAHKVFNVSAPLKIRMGDWDASNIVEPFTPIEVNVTYVIHPNFTLGNLKNDIAILTTQSPIPLGSLPTIGNVCLPNTSLSGLRCWTSGWGKNDFNSNGLYQDIIKEVDVALVDQATCQNSLRTTKLGANFMLDTNSFICAGGESGKDACTGDGGAPLACYVYDRFYLMGLVAWGIGCGQSNIPGVYVNIQSYVPWIQQMTANSSSVGNRVSTTVSMQESSPSSTTNTSVSSTSSPSTTKPSSVMNTTSSTSTSAVVNTPSTTKAVISTSSSTPATTSTLTTTEEPAPEEEEEEGTTIEGEEPEEVEGSSVPNVSHNKQVNSNGKTISAKITKPTKNPSQRDKTVKSHRSKTTKKPTTKTTSTTSRSKIVREFGITPNKNVHDKPSKKDSTTSKRIEGRSTTTRKPTTTGKITEKSTLNANETTSRYKFTTKVATSSVKN